jgi:Ni,Fe-hydrogenase III small subunit
MKFLATFPFSGCGICQSLFNDLFSIDSTILNTIPTDVSVADIFIIPSLIKELFLEDLKGKMKSLPFPRKIVAIGDLHSDLGDNLIYTPDYFSVDVIQGCPVSIDDLIKELLN